MEIMKLKPIPKQTIWGENAVGKYFGYDDFPDDTGQTWCISAHEEGTNVILDGPYAGRTLKDLWENNHELFQTKTKRFPWIIGLVGPADDLSVQVHPDNEYTIQHHLIDTGKNEGWYFFRCEENSTIVYGHTAKTFDEFKERVLKDEWDELLGHLPVHEDDFIYIPAKTIHAMGKGVLVYEIQQNSNLTYRLFDYHRKDANGNERQLHLQEAFDNINIPYIREENKESVIYQNGQRIRTLASNDSFELTLIDVKDRVQFNPKNHYSFISVLDGLGTLNDTNIKLGNHLLVLGDEEMIFKGKMKLIICNERKSI